MPGQTNPPAPQPQQTPAAPTPAANHISLYGYHVPPQLINEALGLHVPPPAPNGIPEQHRR